MAADGRLDFGVWVGDAPEVATLCDGCGGYPATADTDGRPARCDDCRSRAVM